MSLAQTTELEAVNLMLADISEAPVNTLVGEVPVDASSAILTLRQESRAIQTTGWNFNTTIEEVLSPDINGIVYAPSDAALVDLSDEEDMIIRDGKVFDRANGTFLIGRQLRARVVRVLPFNSLPEYVRQVVLARAGRKFSTRILADDVTSRFTKDEETRAWAYFLDREAEVGNYNQITKSPTIGRIVRRRPR